MKGKGKGKGEERKENSWGEKENAGVCRQAFPFLPYPSPLLPFFSLPPIFAGQNSEKCFERAEDPPETLAS